MNVDYIPTNKVLNTEKSESNDSLMNSLKESGKYTCYNRDMEIISNYIKKYYKKLHIKTKNLTNRVIANVNPLVPTNQLVRTDFEVGTYQSANRYVPI